MIGTEAAAGRRDRRSNTRGRRAAHSVLLAAAATAALVCAAVAEAQTNLKVGVINVGRLLEGAPQSKAVNDKLQAEFGSRQSEILALRQKLQTQQETFQRDSAVMAEDERGNLERQIRDGQRDLQRTENEYLEDLNVRRNEEVGKLQSEVLRRVQAYASAQKYDLVVADAIYFSSAIDITAAVLQALQQEAPKGAAPAAPKSPAPAPSTAPKSSGK
jgi:outer membrane protein